MKEYIYIHSELLSDTNNFVGCKIVDGGMMQYAHDFVFSTFAKGKDIIKHQINGSINNIKRTEIFDKDYIGMSKDTSIAYEIGTIKPGEKKELEICIAIDENKNVSDIEDEIERLKRIDFEKEYMNTKSCAYCIIPPSTILHPTKLFVSDNNSECI